MSLPAGNHGRPMDPLFAPTNDPAFALAGFIQA
jgi:hypothetical protein